MEIKATYQNGKVTLALKGHLDTLTAKDAMTEINRQLADCGNVTELVCDASELTYISSSGLRILLSLMKRYKTFRMTEVQPDIYHVLAMTGFTKIMPVEKALRRLSIDGYDMIGQGGVGSVYRIDGDTIIKVFREGTSLDEVRTEITMAKETFVLGMPTAISYDIVRVGNQYGLVYELLQADTLSACIRQDPTNIDNFAKEYASLFRQMHSIQVQHETLIPNALEREEQAVLHISRYFDAAEIDLLLHIVHSIPASDRLLHCDLQTKNVMMQGDEPMLIDMGEVSYGHPMIDLGHSYSAMVKLIGDYKQIIGLPQEMANDVWHRMIRYYFEGEPQDVIDHRIEQIDAVACVRSFSWLSLSDSFPESLIRECQEVFETRVTRRKDHLLRVCDTFSDWAL